MNFDYIIVGAGSAGCVLANRLSEDPNNKVLLIEAGGKDSKLEIHVPAAYSKLNNTEVDWAFHTEPQAHVNQRRMFQPRGKTLGGCSSTNAMAYIRGNAEDYNDWLKMGNAGWGYEDVLPYFIKSEHNEQIQGAYHGQNGELNVTFAKQHKSPLADAFTRACKEQGIPENHDFNGAVQEGAGAFQFTIKNGKRWSAASAFLKPVLKRPNLTILTHAHTKRLLLEGKRVVGVEFFKGKKNDETQTALARKEVILSAGAFGSPQILMLSGIGNAEELKEKGIEVLHHLPGVGKNLQDHVFAVISCLCSMPVTANNSLKPFNQLKALAQFMLFKKGPLTASPLEANAFVKLNKNADRPNLQLHFAPVHMGGYDNDLYNPDTYPHTDGYTILPTLLKPESRGYIALRSNHALDAPIIQPNYLEAEADRKVLLDGTKLAFEVFRAAAFKPYLKEQHFPASIAHDEEVMEHIRKTLETVYHPVGTCKMGNDEMAVVDANLKVHGLEGLRVIDASIMPTVVSGNTNAPSIMIGEKGADLIKGINTAQTAVSVDATA